MRDADQGHGEPLENLTVTEISYPHWISRLDAER